MIPEQVPSKLTCQTCQEMASDPLVCSVCGYWHCKTCLDEWRRSHDNCPLRCRNAVFAPPSESDLQKVAYLRVPCHCPCGQTMPLRNFLEHCEQIADPHCCFNFARCKQFGAFRVQQCRHVFCSRDCYDVYLVSTRKTNDLWQNIAADLATAAGRDNLVRGRFLPQAVDHPFADVGADFALAPESDADFAAEGPSRYRFAGSGRFYRTMYIDKQLCASRYVICISADSHELFKVGLAREKTARRNYCFSDTQNGESFFTLGQMRAASASAGARVAAALPKQASLTLKVDRVKNTVSVEAKSHGLFATPLPFSAALLQSKPFLALAFKRPATFSVVCYEFA